MNAMAKAYQTLDASTRVAAASPAELVAMLFEGATAKLQRARGCIVHQDIEGRCDALSRAMEIIEGLRAALDLERGGELAVNLDDLYRYMLVRLFRANADQDQAPIVEVLSLLDTISDAWAALDHEVRPAGTAKPAGS